jgi:hypothetical protein
MATIEPNVLKTLRSDLLKKVNEGKKRTHSFNVDYTDINPTFLGTFSIHYPSQLERMQIGVTKSALLGGNMPVDVLTDNIAHIAATLDSIIDSKPDWFDVGNPELDYDILRAVYEECNNWIDSFRKPITPNNPEADSQNG